jgi:predicted Zn-dependent peptidase
MDTGQTGVETLSGQDLADFLQDFYAPANALLAVSRSSNRTQVIKQVDEFFAGVRMKPGTARPALAGGRFVPRAFEK